MDIWSWGVKMAKKAVSYLNQVRVPRWHSTLFHLLDRPISGPEFIIIQHISCELKLVTTF